jgi:hypothetical protein
VGTMLGRSERAPVMRKRYELLFPRAARPEDRADMAKEPVLTQKPIIRKHFEIMAQTSAAAKLAGQVEPQVAPPESRRPPPYMVYPVAGQAKGLTRSASHDQFVHPPVHLIRRRQPIIPVPDGPTLHRDDIPLPLTSHKADFAARGVPRRRPIIWPNEHKGLFSEIAEMEKPTLHQSTSSTQFVQLVVPRMREPFVPPVNNWFPNVDDPSLRRTISAEQFQQRVIPRQRDPCLPANDQAPFPTGVAFGAHRSTSHAAFQEVPFAMRKSCKPNDRGIF